MNETFPVVPPSEPTPAKTFSAEPQRTLAATLGRIDAALQAGVGADSPLLARLRVLRERLTHEHLQLAVLGQFKRGKSTFINALLGAAVLPTGVIPLTAVATFIAWRSAPLIVVRFKGGAASEHLYPQTVEEIQKALFRFVAEEANPENRLGVERVDLFYPAEILADGTVIIDTPGVGSTLQHNTDTALEVLPECDAAFFVVSADPPITEAELEYLHRLKPKMARMFFVLNKADYLQPEDRRTVIEFLKNVLMKQSIIDGDNRIFCISARDGLAAKQNRNAQALEASGIAPLEAHLVHALASEKAGWLEEAVRSKVSDILAQASAALSFRMRTLTMPIEELATKSEAFQDALRSIENERRVSSDLLAGEHRRLREALDSRIQQLRQETMGKLTGVIDASLSVAVPTAWEETAQRALSKAVHSEFESAREPLTSAFAADAGAALRSCQDRVNALVDRIRETAAQLFNVPLGPDIKHERFELGEDPYWVTESIGATLIPDPSRLIDRLLPRRLRRSRLRARMIQQAEDLTVRNGENLRWAIVRGLDETFRRAAAQFDERLDETIAVTRNIITDALARRRDQSFAVKPELDHLAAAEASLASLQEELQGEMPLPRSEAQELQTKSQSQTLQ
jgi:GTP-binding protein EngB required for normal cell division